MRLIPLLAMASLGVGPLGPNSPLAAQTPPTDTTATVVYLVRHAERADDDPRDPNLALEGHERARALATLLREIDLGAVFSTDYRRTRQTAAPAASQRDVPVTLYDPRDLAAFAGRVREMRGGVLVVGHSNTTPQLVGFLGGTPHGAIDEAEYDRLYIVVFRGGRIVTSQLLRFGASASDAPIEPGGSPD